MDSVINRINFALDKMRAPPLNKGRQHYLAKLLGTSDRTVRRWYADHEVPESKLPKLADLLDVNLNWLKTGEGSYRSVPHHILLQKNEALIPILPWNQITAWLSNNYKIRFNQGEYKKILLNEMSADSFVLKIELPDCEPYIPIGSLVFIDPHQEAQHDHFVLVSKYDGIKPIIRKYIQDQDVILLESPAPNIPTTKLTTLDVILGAITQHITPHGN